MDKYLTAKESADLIGFSKQRLYVLIREGRFIKPAVVKKRGKLWLATNVEKFKERRLSTQK